MPVAKISDKKSPFWSNLIGYSSITIGTEGVVGANIIKATIQLQTAKRASIGQRASFFAYLSDDANGDSIIASAHSVGWSINTNGLLIPVVANKAAFFTSESDGLVDINIEEAGAKTAYLIVVLSDGSLVASGAITHAA